jgi:hypothetical protein
MCMFCSAVPVALSLGAVAESKQLQARRTAQDRGETLPRRRPFWALSLAAVALIVTASTIYHTQVSG